MLRIEQMIAGKKCRLWVEKIKGELWVHFNGKTFSFKPEGRPRPGSLKKGEASGLVKSPMPGKILKIFVKTGDSVEEAQKILVMEAMKMEYSLESDMTGSVSGIECQVGDQVTLGQLLVKIVPK